MRLAIFHSDIRTWEEMNQFLGFLSVHPYTQYQLLDKGETILEDKLSYRFTKTKKKQVGMTQI